MFLDFLLVLFVVKEVRISKSKAETKTGFFISFKSIISYSIVLMLIMLLLLRMSRTVFAPYLALFVQMTRGTIEGSSRTTGIISGFTAMMTAVSAIFTGRLGAKYDRYRLLGICFISGILISCILVFVRSLWLFALVYGLFMFAVGGIEPVIMSLTSESTPSEKRGALFGIQTLVGSVGWALAPAIASFISIKFSLHSVIVLIPIFSFIALIITRLLTKRVSLPDESTFNM